MEEDEFILKYWHSNTKIVTVVNPRKDDYIFQATVETGTIDFATGKMKSDTRKYLVKAGASERFPGPLANIYLDQMSRLVAQDDEKFQFMIDYQLRAQYYDDLTAAVEDLIHDYTPVKDYLNEPTAAPVTEDKPDKIEEAFPGIRKGPGRPAKTAAEA